LKEIQGADGIGKIGNPTCGDVMWCYIKVEKNSKGEEIIKDIGVKTFGCVAAIATSSMITDLAKGKTLDEAMKLTRDNVKEALDGLPPAKVHCSNLAADALHKAIEDYRKKNEK
ncbi:MAG: iron-sulfur cluster assembly scaffold protein, partial [Nanoarchaeota archaeon]|nr:iron-sulfur cluster assembly scaffold protein [Nanoarchaeota archaeon]